MDSIKSLLEEQQKQIEVAQQKIKIIESAKQNLQNAYTETIEPLLVYQYELKRLEEASGLNVKDINEEFIVADFNKEIQTMQKIDNKLRHRQQLAQERLQELLTTTSEHDVGILSQTIQDNFLEDEDYVETRYGRDRENNIIKLQYDGETWTAFPVPEPSPFIMYENDKTFVKNWSAETLQKMVEKEYKYHPLLREIGMDDYENLVAEYQNIKLNEQENVTLKYGFELWEWSEKITHINEYLQEHSWEEFFLQLFNERHRQMRLGKDKRDWWSVRDCTLQALCATTANHPLIERLAMYEADRWDRLLKATSEPKEARQADEHNEEPEHDVQEAMSTCSHDDECSVIDPVGHVDSDDVQEESLASIVELQNNEQDDDEGDDES